MPLSALHGCPSLWSSACATSQAAAFRWRFGAVVDFPHLSSAPAFSRSNRNGTSPSVYARSACRSARRRGRGPADAPPPARTWRDSEPDESAGRVSLPSALSVRRGGVPRGSATSRGAPRRRAHLSVPFAALVHADALRGVMPPPRATATAGERRQRRGDSRGARQHLVERMAGTAPVGRDARLVAING
jgi:hypothetical protein